jgi:hypothetical protein
MPISYSAALATILAREINHHTKRKFTALLDAAQREIEMSQSSCTTTSLNVADSPSVRNPIGREVPNDLVTLAGLAPARLTAEPSSDKITSGMSVASPLPTAVTVQPVDRLTLQGSYPGDSRANPGDTAKASLDAAADNGGPRQPMRGQQNSKYSTEHHPAFQSTNADDSDAGN